jgi:DNA-binding MarR family transcriptional regulator
MTQPRREPPYHFIAFRIGKISTELTRGASRLYLGRFGVGGLDWRLLAALAAEPNVTANRLGSQIGLNKGAVSRSLQRLRTLGYVRTWPDPNHGRRTLLALTEPGRSLYADLMELSAERERRLLEGLSEAQIDQLLGLLEHLEGRLPSVSALRPGPRRKS